MTKSPSQQSLAPLAAAAAFMIAIVAGRSVRSDDRPVATCTATEVRDRLLKSHSRLTSLLVCYVATPVSDQSGRVSAKFAAAGNRRARILWHNDAGSLDRDTDASHAVFDGRNWDIMRSYFRRLEVSRKYAVSPFTDKIRSHPFLENLGWWPTGDQSTPPTFVAGRSFFLGDVLRGPSLRVSPTLSLVDGAWCHMIEVHDSETSSKALNVIYFDASIDVMRRHDIFDDQGTLLIQFDLGEYRNIETDIWLPFRLRRRIAATPAIDVETTVQTYSVNAVDEDIFRIARPPGTLVYYRDTDTFDQVPGGLELLDRISTGHVPLGKGATSGSKGRLMMSIVCFMSSTAITYLLCFAAGRGHVRWAT